jgi:DNA adenine methylase
MIKTPGVRRSSFFYVGDKYKLIPQLKENFPRVIERFIEPFCGGGSVFLNINADSFVLNDIDKNMITLHKLLFSYRGKEGLFWSEIRKIIEHYGLSATYLGRGVPGELKKEFAKTYFARYNKSAYCKMKEDYNKNPSNSLLLYLLLIYGFNRMLRFNAGGMFNLPVGNVDFNANVQKALTDYFNYVSGKKISFFSLDFEDFLKKVKPTKNDLVYLDPPYLITFSEYNKIWNEESEIRLIKVLNELNAQGARFAVSNVLWHRRRYNGAFNEWAQRYTVVPVKSNYISFNDNTKKDTCEVLVKNYKEGN